MGRLANIAPSGDPALWVEFIEPVPVLATDKEFWHIPDHSLREISPEPVLSLQGPIVPPIQHLRQRDQRDQNLNVLQPLNAALPLEDHAEEHESSSDYDASKARPARLALASAKKKRRTSEQIHFSNLKHIEFSWYLVSGRWNLFTGTSC